MTVDAARTLAAHVGSDVRLAATEVRKLVTYAGPGRAVEARDVEMLTPQAPTTTKVWEFTQAILEGQRERAVVRLGQLIDGADFRPEQVIASVRSAVAQHLTVLAMSLAGDDDGKVGRQLRMQPFAVKMTRERATRLGDRVLMYMHRQVLEADLSLKTGRATPRLAAELLVVELAARAVQAMQMRSSRRA
jgi:DNA polymerase III delta subunit